MLSDDQYSGTTALQAQNKGSELCNQFGDKVNAFFAVCEPDTMGVLAALEQEGLAGKVIFIGFDPGPRWCRPGREEDPRPGAARSCGDGLSRA